MRKSYLFFPVVINIAFLLYFKYSNFFIVNSNSLLGTDIPVLNIILPLGISFFTFQQISFIVASFKKEISTTGVIDYLTYILYFPKLLMGPLTEPADFFNQLNDATLKRVNIQNLVNGIKIFSFGLMKKVLFADTFARAVAWGYSSTGMVTSMDWLLIMLFYTFQIYFDFSGYSDMAVGTSLMLNIELPINFDSPYKALSIRDFWKRWHISLTKFMTKYIYIPLGGNRRGKAFTYINTMLVFLISGFWHGANWTFVLWGLFHGLFSVIDRVFESRIKNIFEPVRWMITFVTVSVLWLLFNSNSVEQWVDVLKSIIRFSDTTISSGLINHFQLPELLAVTRYFEIDKFVDEIRGFWMLLFIVISLWICLVPENNYRKLHKNSSYLMFFAAIAFLWSFISLSNESIFVYFNF